MAVALGPFSFERVIRAVEQVRQRLLRAAAALNSANIPYAVVGGHAVALWVSRADESAVRTTRDVDILVGRADLAAVTKALEAAGFVHRRIAGIDVFLDGPNAKPRDAVHIVFANEFVRDGEAAPNPDPSESEDAGPYRVISLDALVRIKLTAFRDKDRTHLRDMIDVGLIDAAWLPRVPAALAERLQGLIETPGR
jgi:hypothetical protein